MTDQQINEAIAKACGIWHVAKAVPMYKTPEGWVLDCPQFCTDLNAMHEAEKTLTNANIYVMEYHIKAIVKGHGFYFHATARQRSEAFLRTLGKWEATTEESSAVQKEAQE